MKAIRPENEHAGGPVMVPPRAPRSFRVFHVRLTAAAQGHQAEAGGEQDRAGRLGNGVDS